MAWWAVLAEGLACSCSQIVLGTGTVGAETGAGGGWLDSYQTSRGLRASPCGLSQWASLHFLPAWQPQGSKTMYVAAAQFKRENSNEQGGSCFTCYDRVLGVCVTSTIVCCSQESQKPTQFPRGKNIEHTSQQAH